MHDQINFELNGARIYASGSRGSKVIFLIESFHPVIAREREALYRTSPQRIEALQSLPVFLLLFFS